eukprot:IDg12245t1
MTPSATSNMKSSWLDVSEYRSGQRKYYRDIIGVFETRSFREARSEFETRMRNEQKSKEADKRDRLAVIASESTPRRDEVVFLSQSDGKRPSIGTSSQRSCPSVLDSLKGLEKIAFVPEVRVTSDVASIKASQGDLDRRISGAAQDTARLLETASVRRSLALSAFKMVALSTSKRMCLKKIRMSCMKSKRNLPRVYVPGLMRPGLVGETRRKNALIAYRCALNSSPTNVPSPERGAPSVPSASVTASSKVRVLSRTLTPKNTGGSPSVKTPIGRHGSK